MADTQTDRSAPLLRHEMLAEAAGTFILVLLGLGAVAQVAATGTGDYNGIAFAWGFGVAFGVYVAARTSGAHLNPAVSVGFALARGFPWRKVAPYSLAQTLGAFAAALVVRWNYSEALAQADPALGEDTQTVFSTMPIEGLGVWGGFRDQVIGTAILMFLILVLTEKRNAPPQGNTAPLMIGFIVLVIGYAFGANAGYAINPARDFGPRVVAFLTGYGDAFTDGPGAPYWWVPIVAPVVGAAVGVAAFAVFLGRHLPPEDAPQEPGRVVDTSAATGDEDGTVPPSVPSATDGDRPPAHADAPGRAGRG